MTKITDAAQQFFISLQKNCIWTLSEQHKTVVDLNKLSLYWQQHVHVVAVAVAVVDKIVWNKVLIIAIKLNKQHCNFVLVYFFSFEIK